MFNFINIILYVRLLLLTELLHETRLVTYLSAWYVVPIAIFT